MADQRVGLTLDANLDISRVLSGIQGMQSGLNKLQIPPKIADNLTKEFEKINKLVDKYQSQLAKGVNTKSDAKNLAKTGSEIQDSLNTIVKSIREVNQTPIALKVEDATQLKTLENNLKNIKKQIQDTFQQNLNSSGLLTELNRFSAGSGRAKTVQNLVNKAEVALERQELEKFGTALDEIKSKLSSYKGTTLVSIGKALGLDDLSSSDADGAISRINAKIDELKGKANQAGSAVEGLKIKETEAAKAIDDFKPGAIERAKDATNELASNAEKVPSAFNQIKQATDNAANGILSTKAQVEQLQQSTQYFFSLRNMINLFKRGVDDAVQSVKELDKAMTDTAVVTDYSVGDMWNMLPQYTKIANDLGATTQGGYETMTLYFQQGLDQQQAFEVGAETMKMARIAGLDYAETTDMMTAALRGFNMELNETSAKRINDVYSELAAITASDTEELGTAMQRTASIAHSAGMSFEGTTAFLAQAIETTREPAENIGTAMKTIVARFQEMKKNPLEITEVDGEEVSYNKVDEALQSIGVSLKDANGQFRELDQVFLDISSRWGGLTQTQQRYIATVAAGSRQQSRFIAMMANYDRTMQLMEAANNSAGASDEQFGKTMDSLESKLNKLHNAWQAFTMGIANNSMIKLAVDGITSLLTGVNNLIDALSLGSGPLKSFLSLFTAFTGLKAGGKIINSLIGGLGGLIDPTSSFGKGFKGGFFNQERNSAQAISNPIVQAIHQLQGALTGKMVTSNNQGNATASYEAFKTANSDLRTLLKEAGTAGKLSLSAAYGKISKLDDKQQASILQQLPGLQLSLQKNGIQFEKRDISSTSQKLLKTFNDEINTGLKNKTLDTQTALKIFGTPEDFKQAMAARGDDYAKVADEILTQGFDKETIYAQELEKAKLRNSMSGKYSQIELEDMANAATEARALEIAQKNLDGFAQTAQSKGAIVANSIGNIGTVATNAGQGIAQLGIQLSNAGFDEAGAAVTNLGYQISSLGQIAASAGSLVGKITDVGGIGGLISAHPYVAAAGVAVAAIGGIIAFAKAQERHAREAAEETVKTYTDTINQTTEKISTLTSAQDVFSQLSKGVDQYGNNIGLTTEEYDQYLQTSQEVAQIAPELIRGYDAQGHAIIATGSAIDQLIDKQEELQNSAKNTFVADSSINDLIAGVRVSDAFKNNATNRFGDNLGYLQKQTGALRQALQSVGIEEFDAATKQLFGREISLINPSTDDLRLISEHYGDIYRLIESKNSELTDKQKEGLQNAFADLGSGWSDMNKELQPLSQAIGQYLSSEGLDTIGLNLGEEFTGAFNAGLQDLTMTAAMENWDASEIKAAASDYAQGFKEMTQEGSEYANIMEKVTAAQEAYDDSIGESGAIDNYKAAVEDYATELEKLADRYDDGTVAGQLFANSLRETAGHIRNYATESVVSLGEAINTLSEEFTSARGAQERFQEATKNGDYYTAAEGYKGIIDNILDEKNLAGNGSLTFWAGADELLGQKFVDSSSYDQVVKQVKKVQDCFADGSDGVLAFNDLLVENADKLKGLGYVVDGNDWHFDLQTEDLAEYAEVLGMSEEALASLIDKARQWVPMDLGDPKKIRQALEASEISMLGTSSKGESLLYTSESGFRAEARQQGIRGDDYTKTKADAEAQGVRFLNVENLTAKNQQDGGAYANKVLENIGLKGADKTLNNAVAAFAKMGFDLEDTKQILTADGIKLADGTATVEEVEQAYNENAYAMENPTVAGIANDTGVIANAATAMLASMGILTDDAKKKIDQSTSSDTIQGAIHTLRPEGGFETSAQHDAAVAQVQSQIADYESTINLLKQSGNEVLLPQIKQLEDARNQLQSALDQDLDSWQIKLEGAQSYVEGVGKTVQDQQFLDAHAFDIQQALQNSNPTALVTTLQQLQQEGNLSAQTMIDLGASLSHLEGNETYIAALNNLMSDYYEQVKAARDETYKPFTIQTKLQGEDLVNYVSSIDDLTFKEREIILAADLYGDEKVSAFLNEINDNLDGGNETTKSILIEATAQIANGDTAGANELLQGAFGDKAQEVQSKLEIICSGNVANASEVQQSIESQIDALPIETQIETNVKANVTATYTGTAPKAQNTTVNYTKGTQAQATPSDTTVNYTKIGTQKTPEPKSTSVSYNSIDYQKPPETMHAKVIYDKNAKGRNFEIPAHRSLSFGAAAEGLNLPKKRRHSSGEITSLVGEEGFEIGYIPSEQRSVIFGANGPEMTAFPKDTIIYPHKQSQEILRRGKGNHQSLGSFAGGKDSISSGGLRSSVVGSTNNSGGGGVTYKVVKDTAKHVQQKATETAKVLQKVSVWWENIARKTEVAQRKQDQNQKAFEKYIKEMHATLRKTGKPTSSGGGGGDDYLKSIGTTMGYYEAQLDKAEKELRTLDKGTQGQRDARDAIKAAKKTKTKKDDKKAAKQQKKANKKAFKNNAPSAAKISYKAGKKGKTKEEIVNLAPYIKEENGTLVVSQDALKKIKNTDKRKAVADAANKEINDRLSKKYKAEDEIAKAQEAIEKFGEELYNTFFNWEIELTKIWQITQQIEQTEAKISRVKSYQDLLDSQIATGSKKITDDKGNDTGLRAEMLGIFNAGLTQLTQEIHSQVDLLDEQKNHLQNLLNITDERNTLDNVQKKLVDNVRNKTLNDTEVAGYEKYAAELEKTIDVQTQAWKYLSVNQFSDGTIQVDFDTKTFKTDKENGEITGDLGKAIQDYVKELTDANKELNSQYETITSKTTEMNDQLKTLQEQWVGYAEELWQISDEEQKKEVDNLKKVSDSITNTLKNLLDEVKRKLDQRRKEEDNAKTEKGISQKQQRLAALQADTSGGHQVEIAQLQQEIADEQQNYQRSLEDQLLDNLQQQADVAAQQREQQIALQEATIGAVNNAALVNQWMDDPLKYRQEIFEAYKTANEFDQKPKALQDDLIKKFESMFAGLTTNKDKQQTTQENLNDLAIELEGVTSVLETIKQSVDAITAPSSIKVQSTGANANIKPGNTQTKVEQEQAIGTTQKNYNDFLYNRGDSKSKDKSKGKIDKKTLNEQISRGQELGYSENKVLKDLADTDELSWTDVLKAYISAKGKKNAAKAIKTYFGNNPSDARKKGWKKAFGKKYPKYDTGGIANYTGPAWLDGTPSKPELVLNSTDTKNFLALRDVLSSAMSSIDTTSNSYGGDTMYEININVDHLNNDYDVDKVVEKVKKEITKGAGYRNVTQVRNFR